MFKKKNRGITILYIAVGAAFLLFVVLYQNTRIPVEEKEEAAKNSLENWNVENSDMNGQPLKEDKSIYSAGPDNSLHDVYISVFPTKDEDGNMIDFSAFGRHVARDHSYNPILNCNIQILEEGKKLDPLLNLEQKNATIRVRGNSARGDTYKSYKVKLNDDTEEFQGQQVLNINKHSEDTSKITPKFCTDILAGIDHMVSYRTNFMRVWIRDTSLPKDRQKYKYYGLYTHVEQPNKTFLEARGLSSNGVMYKARDFSFAMKDAIKDVDDPEYDEVKFEEVLGIREGESHEKLLEMIRALNDETSDFEVVFKKYFNEDNYLTWLAFSLLMGNIDVINHNFLLYSPENSTTWYFFPWDFDGMLQGISSQYQALPEGMRGGQRLNQSILHRRFFRVPGNLEKLEAKMRELKETYFTQSKITSLTNGYIPILEKTMPLAPDLGLIDRKIGIDGLIPYINSFPEQIEGYYQDFVTAFQYPSPMFVSQPERNPDGSVHFSWDTAYSYQGRTVTYKIQLAQDCKMQDIIFEADNITENYFDADIDLPPGTYYLKVLAVDSGGNEQVSMELYVSPTDFYFGVLEFTIK